MKILNKTVSLAINNTNFSQGLRFDRIEQITIPIQSELRARAADKYVALYYQILNEFSIILFVLTLILLIFHRPIKKNIEKKIGKYYLFYDWCFCALAVIELFLVVFSGVLVW